MFTPHTPTPVIVNNELIDSHDLNLLSSVKDISSTKKNKVFELCFFKIMNKIHASGVFIFNLLDHSSKWI